MSGTRRSIRVKGYDYSQNGAYFVTICTQNRACLFGDIVNGEMRLNDTGRVVRDEWLKSFEIRDEIELDEFIIMPNHFHGIVWIRNDVDTKYNDVKTTNNRVNTKYNDVKTTNNRRGDRPVAPTGPKPHSLGALIAGFKSAVTKRINKMRNTPGVKLWQRNYYERIIRNENELNKIRNYIVDNPVKWEWDRENPIVTNMYHGKNDRLYKNNLPLIVE